VVSVSFDSLKRKTTTVTANGGHDGDKFLLLWISYLESKRGWTDCQDKRFSRAEEVWFRSTDRRFPTSQSSFASAVGFVV